MPNMWTKKKQLHIIYSWIMRLVFKDLRNTAVQWRGNGMGGNWRWTNQKSKFVLISHASAVHLAHCTVVESWWSKGYAGVWASSRTGQHFCWRCFFFSGISFHFYCFSPTFLHVNLVVGQQWSSFFPLKSLLAYFTGSHCAFSLFFAIYCIKKKSQFLLLFSLAVVVEVLLSLLPFCCLVWVWSDMK